MGLSPFTNIRNRAVDIYMNRFAHRSADRTWELPNNIEASIRWPRDYQWDAASDWVDVLKTGFGRYLSVDIVEDIPQPYKGTVVFQIAINGRTRQVAIGYSDYSPIDEDCARNCDLYFKMQHARDGYDFDNVVPGGYVPDGKRLYFHLRKLRKLKDSKNYLHDVYGRFGLNYAREVREKAVDLLNRQSSFSFEGGMKTVSYNEFLREAARSKICIDLPGLGDFCFRLVNYLAVGSFVIAYPHGNVLHEPLVDRKHIVYCKEDFSDLQELCEYYLENDTMRETIAENGRRFFNLYLHKDNLVRYYLRTCLDRLS